MGCGDSKHSRQAARTKIKVSSADPVERSEPTVSAPIDLTKPSAARSSGKSLMSNVDPAAYTDDDLDIPTCDLGESLDTRNGTILFEEAKAHSAMSQGSTDSGIYELDESYSHVITENSPANVIARVERDFKPPYELELEVVGKAVPRLLSGYQKNRMEEKQILASLREEGLIALPKDKAANGLSFDIVDIKATDGVQRRGPTAVQDRLPPIRLQTLEARRKAHTRRADPDADQREKEERRKAAEEEKVRKITQKQQLIDEAKQRRVEEQEQEFGKKFDSALGNRQKHLQDLRDRLKNKHERAKHVQLKKALRNFSQPIPQRTIGRPVVNDDDDRFFN